VNPPTLLHHLLDRAVSAYPGAPAVGYESDLVSYRWIDRASRRLAARMSALGVRRGDRVVIIMPPGVLLPALLYACSRAGAAFVIVRDQAPRAALAHVLDDSEPTLVIGVTEDARSLATDRGLAFLDSADLRGTTEEGHLPDPEQESAPASSGPPVPPAPSAPSAPEEPLAVDPACFIYTSGSTDLPKAVVSTHAQVVFAATAIQSMLRYRNDDVVFCPLPLSFDYGLYQVFLCTLGGARLQLDTAEDTGPRLLARLHECGATVLPAVPSLAGGLVRLLARRGAAAPPLRLLTNTGAAMPPDVLAGLRDTLPGLRIQLMFGLTECKRAAIMPADEDLRRPGACGRPLPGTEIFIADERGGRLPPGRTGEIVVRGPHVMAGYWRRPELTAQRFRRVEGLFPQLHTGDYGHLDRDGYLYFDGRRNDLYKQRGFRVSATEVEAAAHRVPEIEAAAVIPPEGDSTAIMLAVTRLAPHEVLAKLRGQIEDVKVPGHCVVVSELPLNGNGKLDRPRLARLMAGDRHG
jgi:acyl-CoA synthetase (AMP-forming)/AMP-acid ligase II